MAFWLPQNIQKRLLLYVLQQISLFSNIDLSNLDVSIGSKSHFSFHDVNLSLDDLNIPNVQINEGIVDELVLKLTVSGGVEIDGSGLRFVITPLFSAGSQELPSDFLAKSIQDLTNSMLQFTDPLSSQNNRYTEDDISSSDSSGDLSSNTGISKSSGNSSYSLQNMRNKALNVALAKLKIALKDITICFIMNDRDPSENVVEVHLESIQLTTTDGNLRHINIGNFTVSLIQKQTVSSTSSRSSNNDDLSQSVCYSKMEATSLYMSAMEEQSNDDDDDSETTQTQQNDDKSKETLIEINDLNIAFKGLSSINDLKMYDIAIDIQDVHLAIYKIIQTNNPILKNIIETIVTLLDETYEEPIDISHEEQKPSFLSSVDVKCIYLNVSESITAILKSFGMEQKPNNVLAISLGSFYSNSDSLTINHKSKPLLTGELTPRNARLTIADELEIAIDKNGITKLLNIHQFISQCMAIYQSKSKKLAPKITSNIARSTKLTFKALNLSIKFPYSSLCFQVSPFTYDSETCEFHIEVIDVYKKFPSRSPKVLAMSNITISNPQSRLQLGSYDDTLKEALIYSPVHASIEEVTAQDEYLGIVQLVTDISAIAELFTDSSTDHSSRSKNKRGSYLQRSVRVLNSSRFVYKQSTSAVISFQINSIRLKISDIVDQQFGSIEALLSNNFFAITEDSQIVYFSKDLLIERKSTSLVEPQEIVSMILNKSVDEPVLYLHRRANGKIRVILNKMRIHYYARWLELFKKNINPDNLNSKDAPAPAPAPQTHSKNPSDSGFPWELKCLDCALILHPFRLKSVMVIVLDNLTACGNSYIPQVKLLSKVNTLFLIDDYSNFKIQKDKNWPNLINFYANQGFSAIGKIDTLNFMINKSNETLLLDCKIGQVGLSLCADSFQTFCQLCVDLKYPQTFPDERKFKTELRNPIDVFKDIDSDLFNSDFILENDSLQNDYESVHLVDSFLDKAQEFNSGVRSKVSSQGSHELDSSSGTATEAILLPHESYLDSAQSKDDDSQIMASEEQEGNIDVRGNIDIEKVIVKLFDGYDWKYTRKFITNTVDKLDKELNEVEEKGLKSNIQTEANIFDSIYISANKNNVSDLKKNLDGEIQGVQNSFIDVSKVNLRPSKHYKALIQLNKLQVNLKTYRVDEPRESESDNSTDILNKCVISVYEFEVIDNVPTSTWNKFVTLLKHEPWPHNSPMFHMNLELIRPIDFLQAVELVMRLKIAPLRLHVDQDTLEFLIRFGGFKDKRFELIDEYPDIVFVQKFCINSIKLRLDYKPKKVDYAGLRSGQTSELMNFFTLDGSKIILKSVVLYGLNGFDELNDKLKGIWTPDITNKQLPGVLEGLAPVRSFMAIGSGVKTLVTVLMSEYKQEGHLGKSLKKSGNVFVKTATGDFIKLGVKLTSGTQAILENTEELFGGVGSNGRMYDTSKGGSSGDGEDDAAAVLDLDAILEEDQLVGSKYSRIRDHEPTAVVIDVSSSGNPNGEPKIVSLYADQPLDVSTGLKEAYSSLEKHMHIAYDAVWRAKGQMKDDKRGGPSAAAVYVARAAPVAIIRPLIGATEAVSKTLQGFANQVDKTHNEQINDKYKSNRI